MNYTQTYDPFAGVGMAGQAIQNIGNRTAAAIPQILQQNAAWQKFKQNTASDRNAKATFYTTVVSELATKGKQPEEFGLSADSINDDRVTPEQFAEAIATKVAPAFGVKGGMEQKNANTMGMGGNQGIQNRIASSAISQFYGPQPSEGAQVPPAAALPVAAPPVQGLAPITGPATTTPIPATTGTSDPMAATPVSTGTDYQKLHQIIDAGMAGKDPQILLENHLKIEEMQQKDKQRIADQLKIETEKRKAEEEKEQLAAVNHILSAKQAGFKIGDINGNEVKVLDYEDVTKNPGKYRVMGEKPISPYSGIRLEQQEDQWTEGQWQKLLTQVNPLTAGSRKVVGVAGSANMRADRALVLLEKPNITPQEYKLITVDVAGIMKAGVPDMEEVRTTQFKNIQSEWAKLQQLSGDASAINTPSVRQKYKEIISGLKQIDQRIITKNLGLEAVGFEKIIGDDPPRWERLTGAVGATLNMDKGDAAEPWFGDAASASDGIGVGQSVTHPNGVKITRIK